MTNPMPSGVEIQLDRKRRLYFGWNAFCSFEERMDKSIMDALGDGNNLRFDTIRSLLWAGLLWEEEHLTPEEAGNLIDSVPEDAAEDGTLAAKAQYVMERVLVAMEAHNMVAKKKDKAKKAS